MSAISLILKLALPSPTTTTILRSSTDSDALADAPTLELKRQQTDFWVVAPECSGWITKRGFRFFKMWKPRWMVLANNHIAYYEEELLGAGAHDDVAARMKVPLNSDTRVEDVDSEGDPNGFVIHPGRGKPAWEIRCESAKAKAMWLEKLEKSINILTYRTNFDVGRELGKGASGTVAEMKDKRTGTMFALKTMIIQNARDRKQAVAEAQLMQKITSQWNHPNLIQIFHVEEEGDKFYLVMELCRGGELYEKIANASAFSERDASKYLQKIMSGLEALHSHNILHLDIKPENLLLTTQDELKITDFGLAKIGDSRTRMGDGVFGTIGYMAPELITSRMCAPSCDVWAAGVILYIMLVGYPPFWGDSNRDILEKTAQGKYHMFEDDWKEISDDAQNLVKWMLTLEAAKRPTAREVLDHPWITQLQGGGAGSPPAGEPTAGVEQKASESTKETGVGDDDKDEKSGGTRKHYQFDRDLTNTRIRMDRYNTQRRTATASVAMTQVLDGIGTNPLFPFQPTTDGNEYFTEARVEVIRRVWSSISPDACLHYQQFKVLTMHLNILLPRTSIRLLFQFRDVDQDGRISVDDYVTSSKMVDEGHERFLQLAFIIFSGIKTDAKEKTWAESLREASILIPTRNEEFLYRNQIEKLYSTYCEERLEESNLKRAIIRLFAVDHQAVMQASLVGGMKCSSSEDLFALAQNPPTQPELLDKITFEQFKKRAPHSPDILEIFTSHRRSDKKLNRLYGGSSMQEIDEVRDNVRKTSLGSSADGSECGSGGGNGNARGVSVDLSSHNSNGTATRRGSLGRVLMSVCVVVYVMYYIFLVRHFWFLVHARSCLQFFPPSFLPSIGSNKEESADSRNSSRPSECGSVCDDADDLVSNHEMFFKLTGIGDIVTMSAMLDDDVQVSIATSYLLVVNLHPLVNPHSSCISFVPSLGISAVSLSLSYTRWYWPSFSLPLSPSLPPPPSFPKYDSFTRNETIIGRPSTINVFAIVRITSGARKMVGTVSRS
jgi:serine/threonine protein kinase